MTSPTFPNVIPDPASGVFDNVDDTVEFGAFLRKLRQRIPPQTATLGSWKRLPIRCGRPVTQEEIAEAVGVSRNWYRRLESGAGVRASMKLLDRLANTVVFTPEERTTLFVLAIPEMGYIRSR
jgi:transcriptional regulator with XRE-family HTH domain